MYILKTDGGAHTPQEWARATAAHIIQIAEQVPDAKLNEAKEFERRIIELLTSHHADVQEAEREHLARNAVARFAAPLTSKYIPLDDEQIHLPIRKILSLAEGKSFASHFEQDHIGDALRDMLRRDFASIMHIERSWHADLNPDFLPGQEFLALHHPFGEPTPAQEPQATTTAMCGSFKAEAVQAIHNFTITTGNVFKIALIKVGPAGTYGASSTNYSNITGNSDEASGTGYSAGGFAWTAAQNITPSNTAGNAFWQFSVNPSWTSATFSTTAGMIYNSSASNKSVSTHDFGGTQTVSAGTLTLVQPSNAASTSLLQIN